MTAPIHTEERFEDEICEHLRANGWLFDGPVHYEKSYVYDSGYDKHLALFPSDAIAWVKETQLGTWQKFAKNHAKEPEQVFLRRLSEELDRDRPTIKLDSSQLWALCIYCAKGSRTSTPHSAWCSLRLATSRISSPWITIERIV
jgi:type I restriction enzyme, R subunit